MPHEQGFVFGSFTGADTAVTRVCLGFTPRVVIVQNSNDGAVAVAVIGAAGTTEIEAAATTYDSTNEITAYAGGDKLVYDGTDSRWELDGTDAAITNTFVDETGQIYALRVIPTSPVDGAFVFTTPGFQVPAASAVNTAHTQYFIAFR